jgi:DNA-binding transcriptional LysR family regulator
MDWDELRVFGAAAAAGSLSGAGAALNLSQSAVSRHVSRLERTLDTLLFQRHARGLSLTEQGELLYGTVRDVLARVSEAEALLAQSRDRPSGPLKVSTTADFGAFWLAPRLTEFHERYPDITLTLTLDGGEADLSMRQADIAVRMSQPRDSNLVFRRLFSSGAHAYATPEYLQQHGMPDRLKVLDRHRIVALVDDKTRRYEPGSAWLLALGAAGSAARRPVIAVNNIHSLYLAALSGLGIAALPDFVPSQAAGLVRVLPDYASPTMGCYLAYPTELRHSKRVTVFRDFIVDMIARAQPVSQSKPAAATRATVRHLPEPPVGPYDVTFMDRTAEPPACRGRA